MSKNKKTDIDSFRAAMHSVRPLKPDDRHREMAVKKAVFSAKRLSNAMQEPTEFRMAEPQIQASVIEALEQEQALLRDGLPRKLLRQLGSREYPHADTFDLHGMKEAMAAKALQQFLSESLGRGFSCIKVIHGKGLRSNGPAVLKLMCWQQLWQHPEVLALKPCSPAEGGTGAVLILLRSAGSARK